MENTRSNIRWAKINILLILFILQNLILSNDLFAKKFVLTHLLGKKMPKAAHFYVDGTNWTLDYRNGVKNRSTILKKWIATGCMISNPETGKKISGTLEDKIALALIGRALNGNVSAFREIFDSVYGKVKEVGGNDSNECIVIMPKPVQ